MPAKKTTRGKVKAANTKAKRKQEDDDEDDDEEEEADEEDEEDTEDEEEDEDDESEDSDDEEDEEDEDEEDEDDEDEDDEDAPKSKSKKGGKAAKADKKAKGKKKSKSNGEVTHRKKDLSSNPGRPKTKRWALIKALEKAGDKGSSADKVLERAKEYYKKANGKLSTADSEKFDRIGRSGVNDLIGILHDMGYKGAFNKDGKFGLVYKK